MIKQMPEWKSYVPTFPSAGHASPLTCAALLKVSTTVIPGYWFAKYDPWTKGASIYTANPSPSEIDPKSAFAGELVRKLDISPIAKKRFIFLIFKRKFNNYLS
jgi:hypothetical protein